MQKKNYHTVTFALLACTINYRLRKAKLGRIQNHKSKKIFIKNKKQKNKKTKNKKNKISNKWWTVFEEEKVKHNKILKWKNSWPKANIYYYYFLFLSFFVLKALHWFSTCYSKVSQLFPLWVRRKEVQTFIQYSFEIHYV